MSTYSYDDWAAQALTPDPGGSADQIPPRGRC